MKQSNTNQQQQKQQTKHRKRTKRRTRKPLKQDQQLMDPYLRNREPQFDELVLRYEREEYEKLVNKTNEPTIAINNMDDDLNDKNNDDDLCSSYDYHLRAPELQQQTSTTMNNTLKPSIGSITASDRRQQLSRLYSFDHRDRDDDPMERNQFDDQQQQQQDHNNINTEDYLIKEESADMDDMDDRFVETTYSRSSYQQQQQTSRWLRYPWKRPPNIERSNTEPASQSITVTVDSAHHSNNVGQQQQSPLHSTHSPIRRSPLDVG
ncbi:hypothetical protein BLA29_009684, partial [Euroglyphus maynei]